LRLQRSLLSAFCLHFLFLFNFDFVYFLSRSLLFNYVFSFCSHLCIFILSLNVDGCFQFFLLLHLLFYLLLPYPSFRPNSLFNFCSSIFYKLCTLSLSLNCFLSVCHSLSFSLSPFLLYSSHFSIFYPPTMNRKALNVFWKASHGKKTLWKESLHLKPDSCNVRIKNRSADFFFQFNFL
jgi:hypothetical protein